ncbi:MAG: DUF4234 domain-containing protein [Clostridia bacterium]|nr:DUF4234 domain-containing protein [Clostridia bacterium]
MAEQNKRNLTKMIILSFVTLGLYWFYWIYRVTQLSNRVTTLPERSPAAQLLLCLLVPFYDIYWYYQTSKRVDVMMQSAGQTSDSGVPTILLMFLGWRFAASVYLQDKINTALGVRTGETAGGSPSGALAFGLVTIILSLALIAGTLIYYLTMDVDKDSPLYQAGYDFGYSLVAGELPEDSPYLEDNLKDTESVRKTDDGRWALMDGDKVEEDFSGVAENDNGMWYIADGYVDFGYSGTLETDNGMVYTIENGKVIDQKKAEK